MLHYSCDRGALALPDRFGHHMHMPKTPKKARQRKPHFLRAWRAASGMTLEALGEAIGMTSQNLGRIERGETAYTQDTLEAISDALGCPPADLLSKDPTSEDTGPSKTISADLLPAPVVQHVVEAVVEYLTGDPAEGRLWSAVVADAAKQIATDAPATLDPQAIRQGIRFAASALAAAKPQ